MAFVISSAQQMHHWGFSLGQKLRAGDLILLSGPLGAGKTALTQGIGEALGISGITSPTFVISRVHSGVLPLVHVDAYRLQGSAAALFDDLDLESSLESSVVVIEWGDGLVDRLSDQYLAIYLAYGSSENERELTAVGHGPRWKEISL